MQAMSQDLLSYGEAAAVVAKFARGLQATQPAVERVALEAAAERVLGQPIVADQEQPAFPRSTRDGFAVRAAEAATQDWLAVAGTTHAGEAPPGPLPLHSAWEIMTGAAVPAGADAVVMVEHVERDGERVRMLHPRKIASGENIVAAGAQARMGAELVPVGTRMDAAQIAIAASCGYATVEVFVRPRVAILTTGDELVPVNAEPGPGKIRNSNAPMLAALVTAVGGNAWVLPAVADTAVALDAALGEALTADLLLISGGVSAGKFDLVEPALARMGATFHFTGIRMQPGKPLVFGEVPRGRTKSALPFFGLPGNPISTAATFLLFGAPVLSALGGARELGPRFVAARLTKETDRKAKPGLRRFLPALCEFGNADDVMPQVATVPWHGSGDLPAFARSNCFLVIPEGESSLEAGTLVRILML